MIIETNVHVFEKAGLGIAPFHCVGMFSIPSSSLAAQNVDAYNNALSMIPQGIGAGACCFCGMAIMHNFIIKDSTTRRFVVGCECVNRTGDIGMIKEVKAERKRVAAEKRAARNAVKRADREAAYKALRDQRAADFIIMHSALIVRAEPFMIDGSFIKDVIEGGKSGRYISDRAISAVTNVVADLEQLEIRRANSRHFGEIGKRVTLNVVVDRVASYARPRFGGYGDEIVWIISMHNEAGNTIVCKSTAFHAEKGKQLTIKATIKAHDEYRGERQTIVQRIAVKA